MVTHYQRLLNYIVPDFVHVLSDGRIVKSGGKELALELEEKGYGWLEAGGAWVDDEDMAQVEENNQPWLAALEKPARGARAGCRICASAARRRVRARVSRPCATRSGDSRTSRRSRDGVRAAAPPGVAHRGELARSATLNAGYGWCSSTAASPRSCRVDQHCRPASRAMSLAAASTSALTSSSATSGSCGVSTTRASRAQHRVHEDGAFLHPSRDGVVVEQPLQIVFVSTGEPAARRATHPRADRRRRRSQARIVETYVGRGAAVFTNAVTEVVAGEIGAIDHYKVQHESDRRRSTSRACTSTRARGAPFSSHSSRSAAARAQRRRRGARRRGRAVHAERLYLADGERLVDNHTTIDHAKPHCPSHELYKGILDGKARAVFNGKIIVRPDAQKTDAKQTNRALLLSDDATINTKPQLEIFADDVKCTHGAAIGQLDEEALFYLRARGLTERGARHADSRLCRRHPRAHQDRAAAAGARGELSGRSWHATCGSQGV